MYMKQSFTTNIKSLAVALLLAVSIGAMGANTKQPVSQVTSTVDIITNVDYTVTGDTPFGSSGVVNLVNTEHAVVILTKVKPSAGIRLLADHVKINGLKAEDGKNCQVKMYGQGCIILPYGDSCKPLTVYSEQNFGGEAVDNFGLGNTNGFMNTLTTAQLNNRIRSFKLKRGYMVTFSLLANGRGYSRCFIAADSDLEFSTLPTILDRSISSYRIFKWYDASKKGLADASDNKAACDALNVTTTYEWWRGRADGLAPDVESVPHHYKESWPTPSMCGQSTTSPHLKTNNEPGNNSDEEPCDVNTILNNWENLMATGMRLCSPSSHDGSLDHLRQFLKAVDERGWRCDIIDLHCYWKEWNLKNMVKGWHDDYRNRPVWISEWVWGSRWNEGGTGIFAESKNWDNPTQSDWNKNKEVVQSVCDVWNSADYDYIERYYYWNSEANCSKVYLANGNLTPAGEYYASMNPGLAYKGSEYVPAIPGQGGPSPLNITTDGTTATLKWFEPNGEQNASMTIERRSSTSEDWTVLAKIELQEVGASYTYTDETYSSGCMYRIHSIDANGVDHYSSVGCSRHLSPGEAVVVDGVTCYLGGNVIYNGKFRYGMKGWTSGTSAALNTDYFDLINAKIDNTTENAIKAKKHEGNGGQGCLATYWSVDTNSDYLFSVYSNLVPGGWQKASLSTDGTTESNTVFVLTPNGSWTQDVCTFNSGNHPFFNVRYRWLESRVELTNFYLGKLFDTQEEAVADGVAKGLAEWKAIVRPYFQQQSFTLPFGHTKASLLDRYEQLIGEAASYEEQQQLINALDELLKSEFEIVSYNNVMTGASDLYSTVNRAKYTCDESDVDELRGVVETNKGAVSVVDMQTAATAVRTAAFSFLGSIILVKDQTLDLTDFIVNPGFDYKENGWAISKTTGDNIYNYSAAEFYQADYDISQTLSGLPAEGIFKLRVQAFQRPGWPEPVWDAYGNSTDKTKNVTTQMYINDVTQKVKNVMSETSTTITTNTSKVGGSYYVPNGMEGARLFFDAKFDGSANYYENEVQASVGDDGLLKFGICNSSHVGGDWTIFDNFRLIYLGLPPVPNDLTNDRKVDVNDVRALVSHLLGNTPKNFNIDAADINADGNIDISDVTALVSIILGQ